MFPYETVTDLTWYINEAFKTYKFYYITVFHAYCKLEGTAAGPDSLPRRYFRKQAAEMLIPLSIIFQLPYMQMKILDL